MKLFKKAMAAALACTLSLGMLSVSASAAFGGLFDKGLAIDETNFPDANFRSYISEKFDSNNNGYLSEEEIENVKWISVSKGVAGEIADLTGIEHFPALQKLQCYELQLTSLDVSQNANLTLLWCCDNQLTSLDVTHNPLLESLYTYDNPLGSLDVTQNPALKELYCDNNQLQSLDVTHNPALETLACDNNQLTSLDVSQNAALQKLFCDMNPLTSLDISHNPALVRLKCFDNQLTSLDISQNPGVSVSVNDNVKIIK